ncbi:MAG: endo-1,4-beta-xylanase, partial [bacterium]|nr:endo-1,4-beta-xylanase [bacterium]
MRAGPVLANLALCFCGVAAASADLLNVTGPVRLDAGARREHSLIGDVEKGDAVLLSLRVRGAGSGSAVLRHRDIGWRSLVRVPLESSSGWQRVQVPFRSFWNLKAEQMLLILDGADIEVDQVRIVNHGTARQVADLPRTLFTYEGRDPDAPWRKAAAARIEKHRKAGLRVRVVDPEGNAVPGVTVRVQQVRHAFGFGAAVSASYFAGDSASMRRFRQMVAKHFNKVVLENDLKWPGWEIAKSNTHGTYRREYIDAALAWLARHDIQVRGHYVSWAPLDRDGAGGGPEANLKERLFAHIDEKLPAVGTRVAEWDGVNHIAGWGRTIEDLYGPDIFADIVARARRRAPHASIWVNEGRILPGGSRQGEYERLIRYLIDHGQPPDGIGMMAHMDITSLTPPEEIYRRLDRFAALVPRLQLTELDVETWDEQLQADYQRDLMTIAFSHPAMDGIVMWGFWEGDHWRPDAALWREDWSIKPIGQLWVDHVFGKWRTASALPSASNGPAFIRAVL